MSELAHSPLQRLLRQYALAARVTALLPLLLLQQAPFTGGRALPIVAAIAAVGMYATPLQSAAIGAAYGFLWGAYADDGAVWYVAGLFLLGYVGGRLPRRWLKTTALTVAGAWIAGADTVIPTVLAAIPVYGYVALLFREKRRKW